MSYIRAVHKLYRNCSKTSEVEAHLTSSHKGVDDLNYFYLKSEKKMLFVKFGKKHINAALVPPPSLGKKINK